MKVPEGQLYYSIASTKGWHANVSEHKNYNINIVGWRNPRGRLNHYDDIIAVYWRYESQWHKALFEASTRPGKHYLNNPLAKKGTAILAPGYYNNAYSLGLHKGKKALVQVKPVKVYRDSNRDDAFDLDAKKIEEGMFGINIHRSGILSTLVGKWSAGCQVFKSASDFEYFLSLCEKAKGINGNNFSYTLIENTYV